MAATTRSTKTVILYYYRSTSGTLIPGVHKGTMAELKRKFAKSATPIASTTVFRSKKAITSAAAGLHDVLMTTPKNEKGLLFSLRECIAAL